MNETTASERERFEAWALPILGDSPTWRESGPCELAWQAWQARAALPAPADQPPKPQGSSGSLSDDDLAASSPSVLRAMVRFWRRLSGIYGVDARRYRLLREEEAVSLMNVLADEWDFFGDEKAQLDRLIDARIGRPNADAAVVSAQKDGGAN